MLGSPDWALAWGGGGGGGNQVGAPEGVLHVYMLGLCRPFSPPTLLSPQGNETCERLAVPGGSGSPHTHTHKGLKSAFLKRERWEAGWRELSGQDSLPHLSPVSRTPLSLSFSGLQTPVLLC